MLKIILFTLVGISLLTFTSCSQKSYAPPKMRSGLVPNLNKVNSVNVGDTVVKQFAYFNSFGVEIKDSFIIGDYKFANHTVFKKVSSNKNEPEIFCKKVQLDKQKAPGMSCVQDLDSDGYLDKFDQDILKEKIPYQKINIPSEAANTYMYQLLYHGTENNVLKLTYREFIDNMIRTSFQENVTYTLKNEFPQIIKFRNVSIKIIELDNNVLKYEVLSSFK